MLLFAEIKPDDPGVLLVTFFVFAIIMFVILWRAHKANLRQQQPDGGAAAPSGPDQAAQISPLPSSPRRQAPAAAPELPPLVDGRSALEQLPTVKDPRLDAPRALPIGETRERLKAGLHLMIAGETDAGKSTAAMAVMTDRVAAGDQVLILDPHVEPGNWGGLPAIGTGRKFAPVNQAMAALLVELGERFERRARGDKDYPALTIFVDEWPAISSHCPVASDFMGELAQEGRKVKMRLVILTQSTTVEGLGIKGRGDLRENFMMLLLGGKATGAMKEAADQVRPAVLQTVRGRQLVDIDGLDVVARRPLSARALYRGVDLGDSEGGQAIGADGRATDDQVARVLAELPPAETGGEDLLATMLERATSAATTAPPAAAGPPPSAVPVEPQAPVWTVEHVKTAAWLAVEPKISDREVARRLWPEKSSGGANAQAAGKLKAAVRALGVSAVSPSESGEIERETASEQPGLTVPNNGETVVAA
ncbi:MAG TPA: type IV secretory system conjugative DNA transfer family protein [Herpetosiphonaceae bacterium]